MTNWNNWAMLKNRPISVKNTSVSATADTPNAGLLNKRMSSMGCAARRSHHVKAHEQPEADRYEADASRANPNHGRCLDEPVDEGDETGSGQHGARARRCGPGRGRERSAQRNAAAAIDARCERDRDEEHRAPGEVLEHEARQQHADRAAAAGDARPDRDRLGPLFAGEDVGQDRQRRGHDHRAGRTHHDACTR